MAYTPENATRLVALASTWADENYVEESWVLQGMIDRCSDPVPPIGEPLGSEYHYHYMAGRNSAQSRHWNAVRWFLAGDLPGDSARQEADFRFMIEDLANLGDEKQAKSARNERWRENAAFLRRTEADKDLHYPAWDAPRQRLVYGAGE
jgi:hypothetical protein